ncbi:MAG: 50S ribosomal protein L6 [Planctomycetota bacterium]|nr:MAG: 50S ribosomal protein L6 [Planctomycetota bacterium]
MSRIGKQPIPVPAGVTVSVDGNRVTVKGPKGELSTPLHEGIAVAVADGKVEVTRASDQKRHRAMHGTTRALLNNMVRGVKDPFEKVLEIHGTGYSANVSGQTLELDIGFSNKIKVDLPSGVEVKTEKGRPIVLKVMGPDRQAVGQVAAVIRSKRPPSPYGDNKGIRYRGEQIRKKAGKAFGDKK